MSLQHRILLIKPILLSQLWLGFCSGLEKRLSHEIENRKWKCAMHVSVYVSLRYENVK